uniref:Uncharacterized protein n=1 Tax=viral metagenome TaxID=1070528 RepID=A0A6M3J4M7_9ZZZZ
MEIPKICYIYFAPEGAYVCKKLNPLCTRFFLPYSRVYNAINATGEYEDKEQSIRVINAQYLVARRARRGDMSSK